MFLPRFLVPLPTGNSKYCRRENFSFLTTVKILRLFLMQQEDIPSIAFSAFIQFQSSLQFYLFSTMA